MLANLITTYPVNGSNIVDKVYFEENKVYINKTQYFDSVPKEVYDFYIGGYQVCNKWLKDRKGQALTFQDILHYQKVIVSINETIRLMEELDGVLG